MTIPKRPALKRGTESPLEATLALQLRGAGITGWEREYRFAFPRQWRFDFAFPELKIAVEIDGGTWVRGRHSRGAGVRADCEKTSMAALMGWRILRVDTDHVNDGIALRWVQQAVGVAPRSLFGEGGT